MRSVTALFLLSVCSAQSSFPPGSGTLSGNVTGPASANTVQQVNGVSYPASPAVGTTPVVLPNGQVAYIQLPTPTQQQNSQTLGGCGIDGSLGLSVVLGACNYVIMGTPYSAPQTPVTMNAADSTNPRIDAFGVDVTGAWVYTAGTAAATPICPTTESSTYLLIQCVTVQANATQPITSVTIFDEEAGGEYSVGTLPSTIVFSTTTPFNGTHDLNATSAVLNNAMVFTVPSSGTVDLSSYSSLLFYLKSKAQWPVGTSGSNAARYLGIWWTRSGVQVGTEQVIKDGAFGFISSNTTGWQQIDIPLSIFQTGSTVVDTLHIQVVGPSGSATLGFLLDYITLQTGSGTSGGSPVTGTAPIVVTRSNISCPTCSTGDDIGVTFDGGGVALTGTLTRCSTKHFAGKIQEFSMISDVAGNANVKVLTVAFGSYTGPASAADISSGGETMTGAISKGDSVLTGWTKPLTADTVVCFQLSSPATLTWLAANVKVVASN